MTLLPRETWRRNQWVMTAVVFVVFTGFAFVIPFLPLYVRQLGVEDDESVALWGGVLIGVAPLLAGLLAPVWGRLGDRFGQKPMAVRALVSYMILMVLTAAVGDVWQLFVLRAGIGLFGGIGPLGLSMASALAPRDQTGRVVGSIQSAQILSAAIGPLTGGFLADLIGIRWTFVVTAVACAAALGLLLAFYEEAPAAGQAREEVRGDSFGDVLRIPKVVPLLVVLFLVNFVGRSFTPILPLYIQGMGIPVKALALATGLLISAYSVAAAVSAALLGRASKTYHPRRLLVASLAAGALVVLPMAVARSFAVLLVLAVLLGLASGGALTLCYTIGGLMVPAERRATAFGFFSAAALFGGAVSPSVAGLLAHWDLRGIYYVDTALFLLLAGGLALGAKAAPAPQADPAAPEPAPGPGPEAPAAPPGKGGSIA
jgi:DHA1 family multidrug resistance protein-like MFS transporter